jgi:hypothetical protein
MVLLYPIVENESQRSVFPGRYLQPECEEGLIMILNFAELSYLELDSISRGVSPVRDISMTLSGARAAWGNVRRSECF